MKAALYARQSVDKKDSISVETQFEYGKSICKLNNWNYEEYFDKGFSGSNLDRPAFKQLEQDIKSGKINKVICYRLDRISRSLLDFSNLWLLFQNHDVDFISATENFDTSSPIGRAMVNIIMVFAQLELETTTKRITDNYFARAKNGTFVGGGIAFGYESSKEILNGKKISLLKQNSQEVAIIKNIFNLYLHGNSIRSIAQSLSKEKNKLITDKAVKNILSSPVYAAADINMYNYYKAKGIQIYNKIEEFTGQNGINIYGKQKGKKNRIYQDISKQLLVIGKHIPVIDSTTYITIQEKLEFNKKDIYAKKQGKYTWLTGILKCKDCGRSVGAKVTKGYKYMLCSKHRLYNACTNTESYKLEELEEAVYSNLKEYITNLDVNKLCNKEDIPSNLKNEVNDLCMQRTKNEEEIENLVNAIASGTKISNILENKINSINLKIEELNNKIYELQKKINKYNKKFDKTLYSNAINTLLNNFENLEIDEQSNIIKLFIKDIYLNSDSLDINYII